MESIFSISQRYNALLSLVEDESVPQEEVNNALAQVQDDVVSKAGNIIMYMHSLDGYESNVDAEIKRLNNVKKMIRSRKNRVVKATVSALNSMNQKSLMTGHGELKLKKNPPAVIVDDLTKIPTAFQRQKIQVDVDKTKIKQAIKAGEQVPGVHLEQGTSLSY